MHLNDSKHTFAKKENMNTLKRICLLIAIGLMPTLSHAQKCNALDVDELDAFTKEHVKSGTNSVGAVMWHWKLTLKQSGTKYGWEMVIKYGKHFQDPLKKGDVFYCKLENGKVIKLVLDNEYSPTHVVASDGFITSTYLPKGDITAQDMQDFSESALSEMRVEVSGMTLEPKISDKQGSAIQEIAKCIVAK